MAYKQHGEIIESLKKKYNAFDKIVEVYGMNLEAIWDNHHDPAVMLDMLEESNYRQHYYEELTEFAHWLRSERQRSGENLSDFNQWLSHTTVTNEKEATAGRLTDDQLKQRLFDLVMFDAKTSVKKLIGAAERSSVWDEAIAASGGGQPQDEGDSKEELRSRELAQKLRELIPSPFLPKVP